MFLRYPTLAFFVMLAGRAAANESCFCPVSPGASGECGGSGPYERTRPRVNNRLACQDECAQDAPRCKAFTYVPGTSDPVDNCYLYDYVPSSVLPNNLFEDAPSCTAATGTDLGFTLLPRPTTGLIGGKCDAPVYDGSCICDTSCPNFPYACVERLKTNDLEECKTWCQDRGNTCQGFDFDEGASDCYERRYKPTRAYAPNSRKDYTDWFCHARECDCSAAPAPSEPSDDNGSPYDEDGKLCDRFGSDDIVGDEICQNRRSKCVATANLEDDSCDEWCERKGLSCYKAWDDGDFCEKVREISCGKTGNRRSICKCVR